MKPTKIPTAGISKVIASLLVGSALLFDPSAYAGQIVNQTNLVTDDQTVLTGLGYAPAAHVDPDLINPWGISHTATSPFWLSDNGTGLATLYNGGGVKQGLVVPIPPPLGGSPPSAPTGQVNNISPNSSDFQVSGAKSSFIFATEDGTIAAWRGGLTAAVTLVDNSAKGAVYKGLAIGNSPSSGFVLYAANFNSGKIDVFDHNFAPITLPGSFTDLHPPPVPPGTPAGQAYAPFNVQVLNGNLYVTYALQNAAKHDDIAGAGNGFVDEFDLNGNLLQRVATNGALDSPWGLDIAPAGFGAFANDLLIGNFGSGMIDVYNSLTNLFLGQLDDASGSPIMIDGLWALANGTGANGFNANDVYFTAGIGGERHGLFGSLAAVSEPATLALFGAGLFGLATLRRRKAKA